MRNVIKAVVDLDDRLTGKLARVSRSVKGFRQDTDAGAKGTSKWGGELTKFGDKVHRWFGDKSRNLVKTWFTSMKISAAIAFAGVQIAIAKAFKSYVEFESTLRNTTGLLAGAGAGPQAIEKSYKQFQEDIYKLAPKIAKSPQDLAASLYDIVSGGFEGKEATTVLASAAKGGAAGGSETVVVANALVKSLSAYGYEAKEATRLTDLMFQSVNLGIISFDEMSQQLGDVVGLAATAKVPFEELMASIAVMTRKGLVPAEAFTSLNQVMLSVLAPGKQEQEAAASLFGDNNVEKMWSARALAAKGLGGVMQGLMDTLNPSTDQIKRMNSMNAEVADMATAEVAGDKMDVLTSMFGNVRALRGALVLASTDGYTFSDAMTDMGKSAGATDKVLAEQRKTIKFSMDQAKAYFDVFSLQVMEDIAPAIGQKTKQISEFFSGVMESADYKNAKGFDKVKVLGKRIWEAISGWWEDNKAAVSKTIAKGIDWVGGVAIPKVADIGYNVGKAVVPAIWKGIVATAPGRGLIAAVALSWGSKLGGGMAASTAAGAAAGGVGGAGGTVAGGAATTMFGPGSTIRMAAGTALAVTGAVMAVNELRMTYNRVVGAVQGAQDGAEGRLRNDTPEQLAAEKGMGSESLPTQIAMKVWGMLPGRKTSDELIAHERAARTPGTPEFKNRTTEDVTANTIRAYTKSGVMPALKKLWDDPNNKQLVNSVLTPAEAKRWMSNKGESATNRQWMKNGGDFEDVTRQYAEDPTKLNENQRRAVEQLIRNSRFSVQTATDNAELLGDQGLSYENFNKALIWAAPLLDGIGPKTSEWAGSLAKAIAAMDAANARLATLTGNNPFGSVFGPTNAPAGPGAPLNPDQTRPSGTGPGWGSAPAGKAQHVVPPTRVQKNALGSRGIATQPTLFLAGENGAEDFSFTPHFKGGVDGGGKGGTVQINAPLVGQIVVADTGKTVAEVADQLAQMVLDVLENGA